MTRIIDPEFHKVCELIDPYLVYDEEKKEFVIPEDAPKEIHEAYKRRIELDKKYKEE
jgi:hypothetical protein